MAKAKNQKAKTVSKAKVAKTTDAAEQPKIVVRDNPCPNCHETNWADVVANLQEVEGQHQCRNCGYVVTEE